MILNIFIQNVLRKEAKWVKNCVVNKKLRLKDYKQRITKIKKHIIIWTSLGVANAMNTPHIWNFQLGPKENTQAGYVLALVDNTKNTNTFMYIYANIANKQFSG